MYLKVNKIQNMISAENMLWKMGYCDGVYIVEILLRKEKS